MIRLKDQDGLTMSGFGLVMAAALIAFFGAVAAVAFPLSNHSAHVSCLRLSEQTGLPTKFARSGMEGECYIQVDGRWIPEDRWRTIDGSLSEASQ